MSTAFLTAVTSMAPTKLDPLELFLDADIIVQLVIIGLVIASIWVWALMIGFSMRLRNLQRASAAFEKSGFSASAASRCSRAAAVWSTAARAIPAWNRT